MSLDDQLPRHDDRQSSRGTKRLGDEPEDGDRLLPREDDARGTKRDGEDLDDGDRHRDLSQLSDHPGPVDSTGHYAKGELEWKNIGSGVFAKTFPGATRLRTTSKGGPRWKMCIAELSGACQLAR